MTANAEPSPEPDILVWLAAATSPETSVATLADGTAMVRLAQAAGTIRYLRDANQRLIGDVAALGRQLATLQPGEGR